MEVHIIHCQKHDWVNSSAGELGRVNSTADIVAIIYLTIFEGPSQEHKKKFQTNNY